MQPARTATGEAPPAVAEFQPYTPGTGYSGQPLDWRIRLKGAGGTALILALFLGGGLLTWRVAHPPVEPAPSPLVVELLAPSSPPEPAQEVPEGPQQVEREQRRPEVQDEPPPEIRPPTRAESATPLPQAARPSETAEAVPETTAPAAIHAQPAARLSSDAEATWEARLLAHLGKYRRYPGAARARREEGVAYVRFRMNRQGQLLSVEIARSSGSPLLDRAALDTVRRAQPFPPIPDDRPDTLELSVPIEFFVRR
ncbi:energy transducer TonB [Sandaracinobacter sp. RS1-74]|uniref:energy transducer TonB family protein n=1 Tax=Sandaracinobacteroides sayramensis TaxID=2913411 RepID=UPI001EDBFB21|nr:energy transducer TonB [Sandaracinobacteroides sayramensis]MCG2842821.1 energy transducer TonB [Sandaracinobacteroides sayramensis]